MRQLEESPTRASTRATTRIAMLNKISDRVQQSQEEYQNLNPIATTQKHSNASLSSQNVRGSEGIGDQGSSSLHETSHPSVSKRYAIDTLLELGSKVQDFSAVLLKIKPEAIAENIFQYMGIDRSLRPNTRSRGLSDVTNLSRRSMMSSSGINEWEPVRQPHAAPRNFDSKHPSFLQQHEGFIRFLKQHASPPHHRVTAGGRIVPTGPLSPPPVFDYASLNGLLEGQPEREQVTAGARTNFQDHLGSGAGLASSHIKAPTSYPVFQDFQGPVTQPMNSALHYSPQPFMNSINQSLPSSLALTPLGVFSDGTALISCNGICYRCFWNGMTTVMEPLTTGQSLFVPNEALNDKVMPADTNSYTPGAYGDLNPATLPPPVAVPFKGASTTSNNNNSRIVDANVPLSGTHSEESSLKAQLTSLDKYMALHHFDIGPPEKVQLVSRRKILVEAIARIRSDREPSTQMIPIVSNSTNPSRKSSGQSLVNRVIIDMQQQGQDRSLNHTANTTTSFKKCLSPSAPAFIPKSVAAPFTPSSLTLPPVPGGGPVLETSDAPATTEMLEFGSGDFVKDKHRTREVSSSSEGKSSSEVDPWDPAMKIVPSSMIEYAQKYNPVNPGTGKKFCTTAGEFQEAIRRVREQARMWGCVGGNSKDPAYDAEEDIWYAIKDEYPIPLPTTTPDHITCPRPWNWYDSAFNVNAKIEPKINMRGQNLAEMPVQSKETTSAGSPSPNTFARRESDEKAANEINDFSFSMIRPYQSMRNGQQVAARGSEISLDRSENEKRWRNPGEQSFKMNGDLRREISRANYKQKDSQNKYIHSHAQVKEAANAHSMDGARAEDRQAQTHDSHTNEMVPRSKLALSAAQAVYSPSGVRFGQLRDTALTPKTPSSSPSKAGTGTFITGTMTQVKTTSLSQAPKVKQDTSSQNAQDQVNELGLASLSVNASPCEASHISVEPDTSVWTRFAPSELKRTCSANQSYLAPEHVDASKINFPKRYALSKSHFPTKDQNPHKIYPTVKAATDQEVKLEHVAGPVDAYSNTFLKDLLKDSRFAINQQQSDQHFMKNRSSTMDLAVAQQTALGQRESQLAYDFEMRTRRNQRTTDKENKTTSIFRDFADVDAASKARSLATSASNVDSRPFQALQMLASPATTKAISSMAASTHHAQGYLPSYDGAGKAQAASIYRHQSHRALQNRPRVNLPLSSSQNHSLESSERPKQRTPYNHSSHGHSSRYMPNMFGYDGSEEPAIDDKAGAKKGRPEKTDDQFTDRKEVTTAGFDNHRPDHDNEWHRGAVNDFFRDLHQKEVKWMMARQRKNTKTAP